MKRLLTVIILCTVVVFTGCSSLSNMVGRSGVTMYDVKPDEDIDYGVFAIKEKDGVKTHLLVRAKKRYDDDSMYLVTVIKDGKFTYNKSLKLDVNNIDETLRKIAVYELQDKEE